LSILLELYSETSLIGPPSGPTMSGPINETLINVAIKESGPINKVEACYTAVLKTSEHRKSQTQLCFNE